MASRILLINPSWKLVYEKAKIKGAVPYHPVLSLAALGGSLIKEGHEVRVLDFNLDNVNQDTLKKTLNTFKPHFVGFTFTTPLHPIVAKISEDVKKYNETIITVCGGPHATALPERTLKEIPSMDIVVVGEGDFTFPEIVKAKNLGKVKGICFRKKGKIILNQGIGFIKDLDKLPMPAWHLFDINAYKTSRLISKKDPVGFMETSRGCVFDCCFCNKKVHGRTFRIKSVKRVIDEIEYMLNMGFEEIYVVDDGFSTNIKRAEKICEEILRKGLKFPWTLTNGIRADRVTPRLFKLLKKAGCYRVAFGIESGNERVLKTFGKGIGLDQVRQAVKWANNAKIETWGYFVIGLPGETEESIIDTINFAKELELYTAKFSILIPFPGAPVYAMWDAAGLIKSKKWADYNMYNPKLLYEHPNLDWETLIEYNRKAFREFYLRPSYIFRRMRKDLLNGMIFHDIKHFFQTNW